MMQDRHPLRLVSADCELFRADQIKKSSQIHPSYEVGVPGGGLDLVLATTSKKKRTTVAHTSQIVDSHSAANTIQFNRFRNGTQLIRSVQLN